jgi:hypothetical protein
MTLTWQLGVASVGDWLTDTDTHGDIKDCLIGALTAREPSTLFSDYNSEWCMEATLEQDEIGWLNFVEGKISSKWRALQEEHYSEIGSRRSADRWAAGLVTQLLELVHDMWLHRNAVDHEHDSQGLKIKASQDLATAIQEQFAMGYDGLARRDRHYISHGKDDVKALSASDKQAWLRGVQLARSSRQSVSEDLQRQREFMADYFSQPT